MKKIVFFIIMSAVNINSSFAEIKSLADIVGTEEQYLANAYIQGSTFTSFPDNDDTNEQYYGITANNTFAVEYKNNKGIITGVANCVSKKGSSGSGISTSTSLQNKLGKNCWCLLDGYKASGTQPKQQASDTIWAFATSFNSNAHCKDRCVVTCTQYLSVIRNGLGFRSALFNATTIEYEEPEVVEEEQEEIVEEPEVIEEEQEEIVEEPEVVEEQIITVETTVVDVKKAVEEIDNWIVVAGNSRSKWKDVSGNFNTARLASDLTAGVVLGTVGGVVSGVVIKKKQVEKGFDALNCYVAGQKMAGWSDEFRIEFHK